MSRGKGSIKPNAILILKDEDFVALATGKLVGKESKTTHAKRLFANKLIDRSKGLYDR